MLKLMTSMCIFLYVMLFTISVLCVLNILSIIVCGVLFTTATFAFSGKVVVFRMMKFQIFISRMMKYHRHES